MSPNKTLRTRALASPGSVVGRTRYNLYRRAYARIDDALATGYYLEAVALIESLLSDRLEHRLAVVMKKDFSFKTLGTLIQQVKKFETDQSLRSTVTGPVDAWRDKRNKSLHEMVKIANDDEATWESRLTAIGETAREGLKVLRAVDRRCKQLRTKGS